MNTSLLKEYYKNIFLGKLCIWMIFFYEKLPVSWFDNKLGIPYLSF